MQSITSAFGRSAQAAGNLLSGEDVTEAQWKKVWETAGYLGKLPSRQTWIMLSYLVDYFNGETDGFNLFEALVTGPPKN